MKIKSYLFLHLPILIVGCISPADKPSVTTVKCEHAVQYSGYSVEVTGIEVPIVGTKVIKLGKLGIKENLVQEAKALTQALDLLQFADCQSSILVRSDEARVRIADRRHKTFEVLGKLLADIDKSETNDTYKQALEEAKERKGNIEKTKKPT